MNCRNLVGYGGLFCVYWYLLGFPCLVSIPSLTRSISAWATVVWL
jgi:hypothetical protein